MNMSCSLWDKVQDIQESMDAFKTVSSELSLVSFDKIYDFYCDYCNAKEKRWNVSKRFFEKYIQYSLSDFIEYDSFISGDWLM